MFDAMRNLLLAALITAVTVSTSEYVDGFPLLSWARTYSNRYTGTEVLLNDAAHGNCCGLCANSSSFCADQDSVDNIKPSQNVPIYSASILDTSRRRFVQLASTFGVVAFPSRAHGTDYDSSFPIASSSVSPNNNIIAVPTAPLSPFSSTRTYRNIVLSNGLQVVLVKDTQAQRSSVALTVDGAGQFADPKELPGLAHLMEHIVLSSSRAKTKVIQRRARKIWRNRLENNRIDRDVNTGDKSDEQDFEDWLSDNDGDSNGFTAPGFVCFHFNSLHECLPEALERFAQLFTLDAVETTLEKPHVITREIGRVDAELDRTSDASRAFYFLKSNFDPEHPFSRFTAGSKETLDTHPNELGIDVAENLLQFFRDRYVASRATLVVVGNDELRALDRWVSPFSSVMSQRSDLSDASNRNLQSKLHANKDRDLVQTIILRSNDDAQVDENIQTMAIEWPLALVYSNGPQARQTHSRHTITAPAVGFLVSQIISRRGPGSLRYFLEKFNWVPKGSLTKGVPRISFPVDVNGFQVLRMEIGLTLDGFANRSAVAAAVFESIRTSISQPLQLDLIKQYISTAWVHGYLFSPRPPDAVSLAVDALRFGVGGTGICVQGYWHIMPSPEDSEGTETMRRIVSDTLTKMSVEENAIVSYRASPKAIFKFSQGIVDQKISTPPVFSPWKVEPVTSARYLVESRMNGGASYFNSLAWFAAKFDGDELTPPFLNPLIPTKFRPPRPVIQRQGAWGVRSFFLDDANAYDEPTQKNRSGWRLTNAGLWREYQTTDFPSDSVDVDRSNWSMWQIPPGYSQLIGLPLPARPPEPSIEGVYVIQLLSSLPSSFTLRQLMLSNLWLLSFDEDILDLSELGAAAGIAYETSFNSSGLRLSFRGVSQTLPSYVRRFCRRLVQYHLRLLDGTFKIPDSVYQKAVMDASRSSKINRLMKAGNNVGSNPSQISEQQVANQGSFFLECTAGGVLITQGDILPNEGKKLMEEIRYIFRDYTRASNHFGTNPVLRDLLYRPYWRPRDSSPCLLPGIALISDACGRVPR
eukprot:CCRYP_019498-RA/>CCRYP_019498-RA protein AED:0.03 eAED:0.03 QI:415/1/1/1/0.66/0.5/4/284/1037